MFFDSPSSSPRSFHHHQKFNVLFSFPQNTQKNSPCLPHITCSKNLINFPPYTFIKLSTKYIIFVFSLQIKRKLTSFYLAAFHLAHLPGHKLPPLYLSATHPQHTLTPGGKEGTRAVLTGGRQIKRHNTTTAQGKKKQKRRSSSGGFSSYPSESTATKCSLRFPFAFSRLQVLGAEGKYVQRGRFNMYRY